MTFFFHGSASPPASDAPGAALELPRVRMGLLSKLNLLTIGLIFVTATATTGFDLWQEWREERNELRQRGTTMLAMLAELAEFGLRTGNRAYLDAILASLSPHGEIAYAAIVDARRETVASRRIAEAAGVAAAPPLAAATPLPKPGTTASAELTQGGRRYIELIAPVTATGITAAIAPAKGAPDDPAEPQGSDAAKGAAAAAGPLGYVRLGMSFERAQMQFRQHVIGALSVVAALVIVAIGATFVLTRALVAPMRRLIRAARAVGAGKLDVFVPPRSNDELGLLTHTFNHMTQRLAESQAEVDSYQRTLEDKVAQRTRELEAATAQAYRLAQQDILTGLPNRALLSQRLKQIVALAQRNGTHVACLFIDVDHFKRVNDTLGHDSGDRLLQAVARRLVSAVRESDTVARLGGDEFVVVLPGLDAAHAAFETMTVLGRIREAFGEPFPLDDKQPALTCSIGVSMYPSDAGDAALLIKQADTALYAAKEAGRNGYRFYTADMNARVQARLRIETGMRRGVARNEFFLAYQPQVDTLTGKPLAVEALLRWRDPERGVVAPAEFIDVAEESGMIQTLGARALAEACGQVSAWHRRGMSMRLAVNLSVQQLQHESCLATVDEALRASGLPARFLELEITESPVIRHPEKAIATLGQLRERGISIIVDDFGTGYSSLSYLARLPVQAVKIDHSFVHGLERNRGDLAIAQAIIALAHSLELRVIAEGVETAVQLDLLRYHGCEAAQGFLIAHPLEAVELAAWWEARNGSGRFGRTPEADPVDARGAARA